MKKNHIMKIYNTNITDCIYIEHNQFMDERGVFVELYKETAIPEFIVKQSNYSFSNRGTLRGIHRAPYGKLVTCVFGKIYDICIDLRDNSPTYKAYFGMELNESFIQSLYIPPYCGHAFIALENSIVIYHQNDEYKKEFDEVYCYKNFDIQWPLQPNIMSDKDSHSCQ